MNMAAAMYAKTMEHLHVVKLNPKCQNYKGMSHTFNLHYLQAG